MPIDVRKIKYTYMMKTPFENRVYEDFDLTINEGEKLAIIGSTGSGKSTLMQMLNGLIMPEDGEIKVDDVILSKKTLYAIRQKVGYVFQYPEHQLFEETVKKDIAFGLKQYKLPDEEVEKRVLQAADTVHLNRDLLENSIFELSGGEKRRAAMAGVIVTNPKYLILDEPASGLDPKGKNEMLSLLNEINKKGVTIIFVSHDMDDVAETADRVIALSSGKLLLDGKPSEVFSKEEILVENGLDIPSVTKLFKQLHKKYDFVREDVFTIEEGKEELKRIFEMGGGSRK